MSTVQRAVRAALHEGRAAHRRGAGRRWPHELGADSLFYLPLEAVARCIGLPDHLCRACLTGEYPTPTGEKLYQLALRNRNDKGNGRTYEMPAESCVNGANGHAETPASRSVPAKV